MKIMASSLVVIAAAAVAAADAAASKHSLRDIFTFLILLYAGFYVDCIDKDIVYLFCFASIMKLNFCHCII